jgi:hypothetical protein
MQQTLLDGMARMLAQTVNTLVLAEDDPQWSYSPDAALPAGKVPVTIAGAPAGDPAGGGAAVTLATYGSGPEPNTRDGIEYPRMQVRVRHENPLVGLYLDRMAYDALASVLQAFGQSVTVELPPAKPDQPDRWNLTDCYALQSEAQPLGRDESGRWEYVRNYQLTTERTPSA